LFEIEGLFLVTLDFILVATLFHLGLLKSIHSFEFYRCEMLASDALSKLEKCNRSSERREDGFYLFLNRKFTTLHSSHLLGRLGRAG
jgi:hypothetical protein